MQHQALTGRSALWKNLSMSLKPLLRCYARVDSAPLETEGNRLNLLPAVSELLECDEGGRIITKWLTQELELGEAPLQRWRLAQLNRFTVSDSRSVAHRKWQQWAASAHHEDVVLADSFLHDLNGVLSPFVQLVVSSPPSRQDDDGAPLGGTQLVATRDIEAGMFLFSMPTDSVLFSTAPPTEGGDSMLEHFLHTDDLVAQLYFSARDPDVGHHRYTSYLRAMVTPPRNLPFLVKRDLKTPEAAGLWSFFHETMERKPLSGVLQRALVDEVGEASMEDVYMWYTSVVMSRRCGITMMAPLLDKLNHSHEPNAYFTMANDRSMCGLDLVDNLVAGVDASLIQEPHLHVFSIQAIPKGTPVTISYSAANVKEPAGQDAWNVSWGFVPAATSVFTEEELRVYAGVVAARRVERLTELFPSQNPVQS